MTWGTGDDVEVGPYQFWVQLAGGGRKNVLMFGLLRLASVSFRLMWVGEKRLKVEGKRQKRVATLVAMFGSKR